MMTLLLFPMTVTQWFSIRRSDLNRKPLRKHKLPANVDTILVISDAGLGDSDVDTILSILGTYKETLVGLDISRNDFTPDGITRIIDAVSTTRIHYLSLCGMKLSKMVTRKMCDVYPKSYLSCVEFGDSTGVDIKHLAEKRSMFGCLLDRTAGFADASDTERLNEVAPSRRYADLAVVGATAEYVARHMEMYGEVSPSQ